MEELVDIKPNELSIEGSLLQPSLPHVAIVAGEFLTQLPEDLYIPPDALEVILETFEGPLDLLLYLIKRQNLDILNIPIASITEQYMIYVNLMTDFRLELACEYLVMAAMLAEIKSRLLLPRSQIEDEEEVDPRAELVRRLQEYERYKEAANKLDEIPRYERDIFSIDVNVPDLAIVRKLPEVNLAELLHAFKDVLKRLDQTASHKIEKEPLSIRERMTQVLAQLSNETYTAFPRLFRFDEGRMGVVVTFIAILELVKQAMIELIQAEPYSTIHVKAL